MINHTMLFQQRSRFIGTFALSCFAILNLASNSVWAQPSLPEGLALPQQSIQQTMNEGDYDLQVKPLTFEDAQRQLQNAQTQLESETRNAAFQAALEGLLPLRPVEIRQLLEKFDRTQESVELPVYPNPKPEVAVETVSLDPGAAPVAVKLGYGHVTTINILDISGSPWPIEDISWAGNFEVVESAGEGAHILRVSPGTEFAYGNMSIRLLELQTPVIITLETNRDLVHYRFDAIIPEYGPFAEIPLIEPGVTIQAGGSDITSALKGVLPADAEWLNVSGVDGRTSAYKANGNTYIRTPLTLLSPGWSSSASSADGMRVYVIKDVPVLVLSDKGRMVRARLSEREDVFDE